MTDLPPSGTVLPGFEPVRDAFAAVCALLLVDRGLVDLDAPLSTYWPGFTAPATVRHVLAHQAGVVLLDEDLPAEALLDHERMCRALEAQKPLWEPGTAHGEAALVYGHLVGELVAGRSTDRSCTAPSATRPERSTRRW